MECQFEKDTKRFNSIVINSVKCKCGHSILFPSKRERQICSWCGNWCYRTPKLEFEYKLRERGLK